MNNCVQFKDIIQDLIVEGKILLDKPATMRIDNEPIPAHMIGVNWPERQNKRKITVDIREEGTKKCELEIPADDVKIDEQLVIQEANKIQSLDKLAPESYGHFSPNEDRKNSYGIFDKLDNIINTGIQIFSKSFFEYVRLEDREKWQTRLTQPECMASSSQTRNFPDMRLATMHGNEKKDNRVRAYPTLANMGPANKVKLAMIQNGKW
ncbi:unnamed protein product [Prunus armeniaca]